MNRRPACHTGAETSRTAGVPPLRVCMNCHAQVWNQSPILAKVREAKAGLPALQGSVRFVGRPVDGFERTLADAERMRTESPESWGIATAWVAGVNRRVDEVLAGAVPRPWGFGPEELDFLPEHTTDFDSHAILLSG